MSPLPPPAGGIATWTARVLREASAREDVMVSHVDTAVWWRSTTDTRIWRRLLGGTLQAVCVISLVLHAIRKERPAVIHLCTSGAAAFPKDVLILAISRMLCVRSVLHYHKGNLPSVISKKGWEWQLLRSALRVGDAILLLDKKSEESAKDALPNIAVQRIPNPIDTDMATVSYLRTGRTKGPKRIVYVGWVIPAKGVRELVDACRMIEDVPFELNLVGNVSDDFRNELEIVAAQRAHGEWLRFHGVLSRDGALDAIGRADLFVLPSYTEGFPNVVLEAMALGRPIVASKVGAIPEMLDDGTDEPCGVLVSPRNADELRAAVRHMFAFPEEARAYGERAKRKAFAQYATEQVMARYVGLWKSLVLPKENCHTSN